MSDFREQLLTMVQLHRSELMIGGIEKDLSGLGDRIEALESEVRDFEDKVTDAIQTLETLKRQYREGEGEIQRIDDQIAKSEVKLRAVKTNKEYQSTLKEIEDLKAKASEIEDRMLDNLERIERTEREVATQKSDLEEVKSEVAEKQAAIRSKGASQQKILEQCRQEREHIVEQIDRKMHEFYEKVKHQNHGRAMVAVQDEICEVCRMNIPPQLFNELIRMDSMRMCPHCQRIMYPKILEEELT